MLLLEHDAKELIRGHGVPVPAGCYVDSRDIATMTLPGEGPWVVKAQVGVGGRGKAGGIGFADTHQDVADFVREHADTRIKGHRIAGFRIEQKVRFEREVYVGFMVDAAERGVRVLISAKGGVDVEAHAQHDNTMLSAVAAADETAMIETAKSLAKPLPEDVRNTIAQAIPALAHAFIALDATLLEINPLFVLPDGHWVAGDAKLAVDENTFGRQPAVEQIVRARPDAYREAAFKLAHEFDYIELDPHGQVGLLTTGAGLSMMLVDEMLQAGLKPYNFCDVRTGMLRGSPARLIEVLRQLAKGPNISVVLVNIFAGITDLDEFVQLLLQALDAVPEISVPVVARLIGNNFHAARQRIEQSGRPITVEVDLDKALQMAVVQAGAQA